MSRRKNVQRLAILIIGLNLLKLAWGSEIPVAMVQQIKVPQVRVVDATIEAVQQATVSSQIRGTITEISADVDDYVAKGTVLVRFRDKEQRAALDAATARFDEANAEYKRVQEVFAKKLVAKAALDKAQAQFKAAKATLDQAKESFAYTQVRAPYSGIVVKRHVQVGETAQVGQALMTGLSLEKLRAIVQLPQTLIHTVRKYKQTWVWVGKDLEQQVMAQSITISPYADPQSHTFLVRVNLPVAEHHVYPGMHTKVGFLTGEQLSLVIPEQAIARRSEVTGVYVQKDNRIVFRYVRLGKLLTDGKREVLAGLSVGEQVVLDPNLAVVKLKSTEKTNKE